MTAWQAALVAYLAASLLTAAVLGPYLAWVRRGYPLAHRSTTARERRSRR